MFIVLQSFPGAAIWAIAIATVIICVILDIAVYRSIKRKRYVQPLVEHAEMTAERYTHRLIVLMPTTTAQQQAAQPYIPQTTTTDLAKEFKDFDMNADIVAEPMPMHTTTIHEFARVDTRRVKPNSYETRAAVPVLSLQRPYIDDSDSDDDDQDKKTSA